MTSAVNIASGDPVTLGRIFGAIGEMLHRPYLLRLCATVAPDQDPPLVLADMRRLRDAIGWSPRYDLCAGRSAHHPLVAGREKLVN